MDSKELLLLDMLALVYEDMDIDAVEERFVNIVAELFGFDRVGLFFVKHRKGILQGKLCTGFEPGIISSICMPVAAQNIFTRPLVTGLPVWNHSGAEDPFVKQLGLTQFALFPVASKKRISCWQVRRCREKTCPAFGKKWVRCWLIAGTKCAGGADCAVKEKAERCQACPVFTSQDCGLVEGILLVDNSLSRRPIDSQTVTVLSLISHAVGTAINNSKNLSHALREAIFDDLTGLHNRRYFNERLLDEVERSRRYSTPLSLLLCDIDHFKRVNDTCGHPAGDAVLSQVAGLLRDKLRQSDLVARYGGEEFGVLLLNTGKQQAIQVAESLRCGVEKATFAATAGMPVTISIGVATLGEDASSLDSLIDRADKGLYCAKASGRNQVASC